MPPRGVLPADTFPFHSVDRSALFIEAVTPHLGGLKCAFPLDMAGLVLGIRYSRFSLFTVVRVRQVPGDTELVNSELTAPGKSAG